MDFKLVINLISGLFSFNPNNMRYPRKKRLRAVAVFLPVFLVLLVVHRLFLLLDYVFFPGFWKTKVHRPVFIVAAPRSGTTYLYHALARRTSSFTCFQLWEIVFAPSICEKYLLLGCMALDRRMGNPVKQKILALENRQLGHLKSIHPIGLNLPEEDEAILLWDLTSLYLNFFYPDSHFFDELMRFDQALPAYQKRHIQRCYRRYIQRHNYVFNRDGKRRFLSKNPLLMCKLASLKEVFPDAQVLTIYRCPGAVFPSTLALNTTLYRFFSDRPPGKELNARTKAILLDWYLMAEEALQQDYPDDHLAIAFSSLVAQHPETEGVINRFLALPDQPFLPVRDAGPVRHKSRNQYRLLTESELTEVLNTLPFLATYCQEK
jgi:hypothetical protein